MLRWRVTVNYGWPDLVLFNGVQVKDASYVWILLGEMNNARKK